MNEEDRIRRLTAKRFNERTKLFATLQNNIAIAIPVGAFVLPWANAQIPNATTSLDLADLNRYPTYDSTGEPRRVEERGLR